MCLRIRTKQNKKIFNCVTQWLVYNRKKKIQNIHDTQTNIHTYITVTQFTNIETNNNNNNKRFVSPPVLVTTPKLYIYITNKNKNKKNVSLQKIGNIIIITVHCYLLTYLPTFFSLLLIYIFSWCCVYECVCPDYKYIANSDTIYYHFLFWFLFSHRMNEWMKKIWYCKLYSYKFTHTHTHT